MAENAPLTSELETLKVSFITSWCIICLKKSIASVEHCNIAAKKIISKAVKISCIDNEYLS